MADLGFPSLGAVGRRRGRKPQSWERQNNFGQIYPENYMKMKEIRPSGRCIPAAPPWICQWVMFKSLVALSPLPLGTWLLSLHLFVVKSYNHRKVTNQSNTSTCTSLCLRKSKSVAREEKGNCGSWNTTKHPFTQSESEKNLSLNDKGLRNFSLLLLLSLSVNGPQTAKMIPHPAPLTPKSFWHDLTFLNHLKIVVATETEMRTVCHNI